MRLLRHGGGDREERVEEGSPRGTPRSSRRASSSWPAQRGAAAEGPVGRIVPGRLSGGRGSGAAPWPGCGRRASSAGTKPCSASSSTTITRCSSAGGPKPPDGVRGLACFSKGGRKDTIFLRKDLFAHFDVGLEGTGRACGRRRRGPSGPGP
ncbi:MAG: hypothetical protein MZV64_49900 [Ignavibacteriales bacterium]|nr:hypothetical protein [Ignavibacteriales bacterium]